MKDLEFDPKKELANIDKHDGVGFEEASTVLDDPYSTTTVNYHDHEERYYTVGVSSAGRLLVVHWTCRGDNIRVISSYPATINQRKQYAKRIKK